MVADPQWGRLPPLYVAQISNSIVPFAVVLWEEGFEMYKFGLSDTVERL